MRNLSLLSLAGLSILSASHAFAGQTNPADPRANETKAQRDARMHWWREARFGMFIHWGLYSVPAGVYDGKDIEGAGEWIMRTADIPVGRYADYAKKFDPEKFNADQWVSYAKAAGMKYIVMTAKHHEGFAMYPTKVDDWGINGRTVFKRDPIGEMSAACKKAGIRFGVYYSQNLDWHHVGGGTAGPAWDQAQKGSFHDYITKVSAPQVRELLSTYKPAVLWWDINANLTPDETRDLTSGFASDPSIISNNRLGGGVQGDTETPEQFIPATGFKGRDWETCMTMNDTWGYKSTDMNFKSTTTLVRNLIDIASKGGNYLLNVGPTSEGLIPDQEVERLHGMGDWMKHNGSSIYATTASPFKKLPFDGRATVRGNTLFVNVYSWPNGGVTLPGLETSIKGAKVLATGEKLSAKKDANGVWTISKPKQLDEISTSVAVSLSGAPMVNEPEVRISPSAGGVFHLGARDAELQGGSLQVEHEDPNLGYWTDRSATASWKLKVATAGKFEVSLDYSCAEGSEGSTFKIKVDGADSGVTGTVAKTGSWGDYEKMTLSQGLTLLAGNHTVEIVPIKIANDGLMNLRGITLTPN